MNTARDYLGGAGTQTSGLGFGGEPVSPAVQAYTESWNGSSWTEVGDMNTGKSGPFGAGESNTAALAAGGELPSGSPAIGAIAELWNGSSWTEVADLNTARFMSAFTNTGTTSSAINIGGNPGDKVDTEEWTGAGAPIGAWSTQTSVNTGRSNVEGAGSSAEAALIFGGQIPGTGVVDNTESWDGSTWTEVNDLNTARNGFAGNGTSTSALGYGADDPARSAITESWNGTNWTEVGDLNTAKRALQGVGADNTSALAFGGETAPTENLTETELWNGSSWTEVNNLNTGRGEMGGTGIATAALAIGGRVFPPTTGQTKTEQWNGSSWTEMNDINTGRYGAVGSQFNYSDSFLAGCATPSVVANTELWNGASWVEVADLSTARQTGAGAGTQSEGGLVSSGGTPGATAVVEEWSSSSVTTKVLTD